MLTFLCFVRKLLGNGRTRMSQIQHPFSSQCVDLCAAITLCCKAGVNFNIRVLHSVPTSVPPSLRAARPELTSASVFITVCLHLCRHRFELQGRSHNKPMILKWLFSASPYSWNTLAVVSACNKLEHGVIFQSNII